MKKITIIVLLFISLISLSSCEKDSIRELRIYNWSDYIDFEVLDDFVAYIEEKHGETISVVYDTFETNESMYNTIRTGKTSYDLICPSEYMIQKMKKEQMIQPLDLSLLDGYLENVSPYFYGVLDQENLNAYAAGYMWGTLGIIYNPEELYELDTNYDISSWDVLWNKSLKGTVSIKDSVRDTYVAAIFKVYKEEINRLMAEYDISDPYYNQQINVIMNRVDENTLIEVEKVLRELKLNIYGMEVDSGKGDIVTGKIAMNIAWSGDAVYSMDLADEEGIELRYSVPNEGSNVWFDGWVMPKSANIENKDLIHEFINFVSVPENAARNMNEIGYTSAVAGEAILDLIGEWYGIEGYIFEIEELEASLADETVGSASYNEIKELIDELEAEMAEIELVDVDLTYFFNGPDSEEKVIVRVDSSYIDRQFTAQYPDYETVSRCGVMQDFGDQNERVLQMWINIKADKAPISLIVILVAFVFICVGIYIYSKRSVIDRRRRKKQLAK